MKVSTCNNAYSCRKQNHPLLSLSPHDIQQMLLLTRPACCRVTSPSRTLRPHLLTHTCPARPLLTNLVPRPALRAHYTMRAADAYAHVSAAQPRLRTKPADAYQQVSAALPVFHCHHLHRDAAWYVPAKTPAHCHACTPSAHHAGACTSMSQLPYLCPTATAPFMLLLDRSWMNGTGHCHARPRLCSEHVDANHHVPAVLPVSHCYHLLHDAPGHVFAEEVHHCLHSHYMVLNRHLWPAKAAAAGSGMAQTQ
jgi:hypothetical protein